MFSSKHEYHYHHCLQVKSSGLRSPVIHKTIYVYWPRNGTSVMCSARPWPVKYNKQTKGLTREVVILSVLDPRVGTWPVMAPGRFPSRRVPCVHQLTAVSSKTLHLVDNFIQATSQLLLKVERSPIYLRSSIDSLSSSRAPSQQWLVSGVLLPPMDPIFFCDSRRFMYATAYGFSGNGDRFTIEGFAPLLGLCPYRGRTKAATSEHSMRT